MKQDDFRDVIWYCICLTFSCAFDEGISNSI